MSVILTKKELLKLESKPKTRLQRGLDFGICLCPIFMGILALFEYYLLPNVRGITITNVYGYFLSILILGIVIFNIVGYFKENAFAKLRERAPFYTFIFFLLMAYDCLTLKSGILVLPYFPWVDQVLNVFLNDTAYLLDCTKNSLILLFTGYFTGAILGLLTGIACGYNRKLNYWLEPFMKLLGAIPSITWLPIVLVLASSLFAGSVFIIALGVWFALTIATITGIRNIDPAYYDAAKTLGAKGWQLIVYIAIPSAIPNIFQGLIQGMSSACTALLVAEMLGVESGLGWYITWQKSWALFDKMYAAIVLICIIFVLVNFILARLRNHVLRWKGEIA